MLNPFEPRDIRPTISQKCANFRSYILLFVYVQTNISITVPIISLYIFLCSELDELTACYISIFNGTCGTSASGAMGGLITKAFHDPFYLRFDFIPDCQLHEKLYHKKQQQKRKQAEKQKHHIRHHSGEEEQSHNNNGGVNNREIPKNTGSPDSQKNPGSQSRNPKQRTQIKTQTVAHGSASAHSRLGIYLTALISLVFMNL